MEHVQREESSSLEGISVGEVKLVITEHVQRGESSRLEGISVGELRCSTGEADGGAAVGVGATVPSSIDTERSFSSSPFRPVILPQPVRPSPPLTAIVASGGNGIVPVTFVAGRRPPTVPQTVSPVVPPNHVPLQNPRAQQSRAAASNGGSGGDSNYERWDQASEGFLLEWLEAPGNYAQYRSAGKKRKNGSTVVSGKRKSQVLQTICEFLCSKDIFKSTSQIHNKIKYMESSRRKASDYLRNIGEGLTSIDEKRGISAIKHKVLLICPLFERLNEFMDDTASMHPIQPSMIGLSPSQLPPRNREEGPKTVDCESPVHCSQEFAEDGSLGCQQPHTQCHTNSQSHMSTPEQSRRTTPPSCKTKQGKKPQGFGGAFLSLGEHTRHLGEEKLAIKREWQKEHFQIMNRKLDLQHEEFALRRQELQLKEKELQLQLEILQSKKPRRELQSRGLSDEADSIQA